MTTEEQIKAALYAFFEAGRKAWADVPDHVQWVRELRGDTEDDTHAMLPKTGSASSGMEHENKGDDMGTESEAQAAAYRPESIEREAPTPPVASVATSRVTLELTHKHDGLPIADWPWRCILAGEVVVCRSVAESVRVVPEVLPGRVEGTHWADWERLRAERDAAIKRAEAAELLHETQKDMMAHYVSRIEALSLRCELRDRDFDEWKKGETRVAELEGEKAAAIRDRDDAARNRDRLHGELGECREELAKAIRERDKFRRSFHWSEEAGTRLVAERDESWDDADTLRARVAELEGETKGLRGDVRAAETEADKLRGQLESVADRAAAAETALESAPAASDAGLTPHVWGVVQDLIGAAEAVRDWGGQPLVRNEDRYFSAVDDLGVAIAAAEALLVNPLPSVPASDAARTEVVWGVMVDGKIDRTPFAEAIFLDKATAEIWCRIDSLQGKGTVVPFYPPQLAPGWLTPEEREAVEYFAQFVDGHLVPTEWSEMSAKLRSILARETPPEVVAPKGHGGPKLDTETTIQRRDRQWCAAIAASGGKVKEVG